MNSRIYIAATILLLVGLLAIVLMYLNVRYDIASNYLDFQSESDSTQDENGEEQNTRSTEISDIVAEYLSITPDESKKEELKTKPSEEPETEHRLSETVSDLVINGYKLAITTVFWVGEKANKSNDHISNAESAWDVRWAKHYGGVDDPDDRCNFYPCEFVPDENPFYFALPYNDFDDDGKRKSSALKIPWYESSNSDTSLLKNRWIKVIRSGNTCYGQWQDAGPGEYDDFEYVFGEARMPKNVFGVHAGLDISPALRDCLDADGISATFWKFVDEEDVPDGPWLDIVTTSQIDW